MTGLLMTGFVTENISMGTGFAHFDRRNARNLNSDSGMRDEKRKKITRYGRCTEHCVIEINILSGRDGQWWDAGLITLCWTL